MQPRFSITIQRYFSRNQRMNFLCILIFSTMVMIFIGTASFQSALSRPVDTTKRPRLINLDDVIIDQSFHLRERVISNKLNLAAKQMNKTWKQEIHAFLTRESPFYQNRSICADYWAVVIEYSENVVETATRLPNWCIILVYEGQEYSPNLPGNVFMLDGPVQQKLAKISEFYKESLLLPRGLNSVQKNLGYLWAIFHEVKMIWDFDSINELIVNQSVFSFAMNETIEVITVLNHTGIMFNPFSLFTTQYNLIWTRGFPFGEARGSKTTRSEVQTLQTVLSTKNLALVHSLIEGYGDVGDASFRFIKPNLPIQFRNISNDTKSDVKLIAPRRTFSPYDQQATLHLRSGLWSLYLPVTIDQQVTDVFRSFIMERLMWDTNLQISFVGSFLMTRYTDPEARETRIIFRKSENTRQAEKAYFYENDKLVRFLMQWLTKPTNFMDRAEQLFLALYEHDYIKMYDVYLFQLWLKELYQIGYTFPEYTP